MSASLDDYRCVIRFRVPFHDVDQMRHVNHAAYIVWLETVRGDYFADVLREDVAGERGIIMASLSFEYAAPIEYRAHVAVGARIARFGAKSFDFVYDVWDESAGRRAGFGRTTVVAFDYVADATIRVPENWRERAAAFEAVAPDV